MKKYLILAETDDLGYFIEVQENFDVALQREKRFFELAFNPPTDHERMRREFTPIGTYPVHDKFAVFFDHLGGSCNGSSSTYIVEIDEDFSFEWFASLRNSSRKVSFIGGENELYDLEEKYGSGILEGAWEN